MEGYEQFMVYEVYDRTQFKQCFCTINLMNKKKSETDSHREHTGGCQRRGREVGTLGKREWEVQASSYRMNKSWG